MSSQTSGSGLVSDKSGETQVNSNSNGSGSSSSSSSLLAGQDNGKNPLSVKDLLAEVNLLKAQLANSVAYTRSVELPTRSPTTPITLVHVQHPRIVADSASSSSLPAPVSVSTTFSAASVQSTLTPTNSGLVKESSSSAVPNSRAAPAGNRSRKNDGLDMLDVGKLEKEQELLNSLIDSGFKKGKVVVSGGGRVGISVLDQGTASISLTSSDSSFSSSSEGSDSGSKSKMVAAMQAVVKTAKKKKKFKQFHSFAELSRWLLKRACKLDTLEAVRHTNDLVVVLSDLNKKMGF
jgi:hypothetical protein